MASLAIGAGIQGVTSLIGGLLNRGAAKKAAKLQADAATRAGQVINEKVNEVNPRIMDQAAQSGELVRAQAGESGGNVIAAGQQANKLLDPYTSAGADASGAIQAGLVPGGDFNKTFNADIFHEDPGYEFTRSEGMRAQAMRDSAGGVSGGGALKELARYTTGLADQTYQAAFNRFQQSAQSRFDRLNAVAGRGATAATTQGNNDIGTQATAAGYNNAAAIDAAGYLNDATSETSKNSLMGAGATADALTGAANAEAAGKVASTNAITGAISGVGNAVGGYLAARPNKLANPALAVGRTAPYQREALPNRLSRPQPTLDPFMQLPSYG